MLNSRNCKKKTIIFAENLIWMNKIITTYIFTLFFLGTGIAQVVPSDTISIKRIEITGLVLDAGTNEPLPYSNIFVKQKHSGTISNETGGFSLDITFLEASDTVQFQYIGYQTVYHQIGSLINDDTIFLKEDIINLSELLVFGDPPNPKDIVKKVLIYKDSNYRKTTSRKQVFVRDRDIVSLKKIELNTRKSSIDEIDSDMIELIEDIIPRYTTSYTDFLGNLYTSGKNDDSIKLKVEPIRTVSLKEKDIAELDRLEEVFENVVKNTQEDEYWKFKTGIISQKIDMDDNSNDTIKDTIPENRRKTRYLPWRFRHKLSYVSFSEKDQWEFLHKTGKYHYILVGGTRVGGEDVYIIDFNPKDGGMYTGRMFISKDSYALIRADYQYDVGKTGRDIHLFGIGYTENMFYGSIYFEKGNSGYELKYFSYKSGNSASIDRSFSLIKKRKRWLFNKKVSEIKIGVDFFMDNEESVEFLVLDNEEISRENYLSFSPEKYYDIIFVDQFNDRLWDGYSIIEPTQKMKDYKKQELNFLK